MDTIVSSLFASNDQGKIQRRYWMCAKKTVSFFRGDDNCIIRLVKNVLIQ